MSDFAVEVRRIESITQHDNADRLEIGRVEGLDFQFIVGKGEYEPGDWVVYFPVDSVLPQSLIEKLGIKHLSGKQQNRVKTVKLRGKISQGVVIPANDVFEAVRCIGVFSIGDDVTEILGVTKYEPPPVFENGANLLPLPYGMNPYDIQGYERYPEAVAQLMDMKCEITEKLEGMNFSITVNVHGEVWVNQRNFTIQEIDGHEHAFWATARKMGVIEAAHRCLGAYSYPAETLTLYGEFLGPNVQGNYYRLMKHTIRFYDITAGYRFLSPNDAYTHTVHSGANLSMPWVPTLWHGMLREYLQGRTIAEASNGPSAFNPSVAREGIVIKPLDTMCYSKEMQGRLIIKKRSPEYLAGCKR